MGTLMPIKIWVYLDRDKIVAVDLENDEGVKTSARFKKLYSVSREKLTNLI